MNTDMCRYCCPCCAHSWFFTSTLSRWDGRICDGFVVEVFTFVQMCGDCGLSIDRIWWLPKAKIRQQSLFFSYEMASGLCGLGMRDIEYPFFTCSFYCTATYFRRANLFTTDFGPRAQSREIETKLTTFFRSRRFWNDLIWKLKCANSQTSREFFVRQ